MIKSIKRAVIKAKICYYEWALSNVRKGAARLEKERVECFREMSQKELEWVGRELTEFTLDKLELIQKIEVLNLELVRLDWQK